MTFLTYVLAFFHFNTEIFYFKTAKINAGTIGPMIISSKLHTAIIKYHMLTY